MREVAWVIFDEIHYMRDKGMSWQRKKLRFLRNGCNISCFFLILKVVIKVFGLIMITTTMYLVERGVVWEETIILLPDNVHYVFLSATIPNARQFAEWICHLHKQVSGRKTIGIFVLLLHIESFVKTPVILLQPCHVVYTDYRPTPLQHYIFPAGGDGIHMVVDEQVSFWASFSLQLV